MAPLPHTPLFPHSLQPAPTAAISAPTRPSLPKTAAAKRLVAPNGGSAARDLSSFAPDDHVVRVTFNGSSTAKPLVASLAAEKGILVSVLSADTRDLSGQCYGSMLLKLPADVEQAKQAAAYMRAEPGITVEEVTGE